ncbi:Hint domain-containing protein [Falsirhodobacter algicola]|uniref:Hemolysin n=1 Tax=Falsirhodobacter algicola TaxID=2692330 RepID=A0A8J8MSN6_9RHOB|nr:Hint domain-containing protein [Falsirhodobacter algicola]QUS35752.1 hemolysin [Falsirhodobacter algicola]
MSDTSTWGWYVSKTWPKFAEEKYYQTRNGVVSDNADDTFKKAGNGTKLDVSKAMKTVTWHDDDNDGLIRDSDTDDGSGAGKDRVIIDGKSKTIYDMMRYENSTVRINGQLVKMPVDVFVFTDGTYLIRPRDAYIPKGANINSFSDIQLGQWDGVENYGLETAARQGQMPCFAAGTMILTPEGERRVEDLVAGDLVQTLDHGPQPVRWAGARAVSGQGTLAPILFAPGAAGNDRPMRVSPQHRILVEGWRAEMTVGAAEVLVAAKHLANDITIRAEPCETVTYVHLMFDAHEIVRSDGAWTESYHPGDWGASVLDQDQWNEITGIFPELLAGPQAYGPTARPCVAAWEARVF